MNTKNDLYINIFISIFTISISVLLFYSIYDNGSNLAKMINSAGDYFFDLTYPILSAKDISKLYDSAWIVYPPISYLWYKILYKIINVAHNYDLSSFNTIMLSKEILMNYISIVITTIQTLIFAFLISSVFKGNNYKYKILLPIYICLSVPYMFLAIYNGNNVALCTIVLTFFVFFCDSNNNILLEISLISLAFATSLKVYPALLGLYYIKKKKFKYVFRLICYGTIFVFIPFFLLGADNIYDQIIKFFNNIFLMSNGGVAKYYINYDSI